MQSHKRLVALRTGATDPRATDPRATDRVGASFNDSGRGNGMLRYILDFERSRNQRQGSELFLGKLNS